MMSKERIINPLPEWRSNPLLALGVSCAAIALSVLMLYSLPSEADHLEVVTEPEPTAALTVSSPLSTTRSITPAFIGKSHSILAK